MAPKTDPGESAGPPNSIKAVERRRPLEPTAAAPEATVEVARIWLPAGVTPAQVVAKHGALQAVSITLPTLGEAVAPPDIAAESVTAAKLRRLGRGALQGDGHRPPHLPVHFKPADLRPAESLEPVGMPEDAAPKRRGGAVFAPDNRYIYRDNAFPWCTVGLVETENGWGSGTMVGRRLVLTASHVVVWKPNSAGWMKFTPAAHGGGTPPFGQAWAQRVIYWRQNGRRLNDDETAFDYAVLVLDRPLGDLTGYTGYRTFDKGWLNGAYWQNLGYPGDIGGGSKPSFSGSGAITSADDFSLGGQTAYLLGNFIDYMAGQSGGPYWGWWGNEPWPRVVGTASTLPDAQGESTAGDNEGGGGPALSALIGYARANYP